MIIHFSPRSQLPSKPVTPLLDFFTVYPYQWRRRSQRRTDSFSTGRQMSQVGLTETVKGDPKKFEVWLPGRAEVYTILATSVDDRETWVRAPGSPVGNGSLLVN